jgi:hypothetical protein
MSRKQIEPEQISEIDYCRYGLNHLDTGEKPCGCLHMLKPPIDQIMDKILVLEMIWTSMEHGVGYISLTNVILTCYLLMLDSNLEL